MRVDLHVHTYYSADADGTPEAALNVAAEAGIDVLALSEHNTCAHIDDCLAATSERVRYVPATEISCTTRFTAGREVHLLCYFVDSAGRPWRSKPFTALTDTLAAIQRENLFHVAQAAGIPTAHVEDAIAWCFEHHVIHRSVAPSIYFVKRWLDALATESAMVAGRAISAARKTLRESGGLVPYPSLMELRDLTARPDTRWFLAHPARYDVPDEIAAQMLTELMDIGLAGIETNSLTSMDAEPRWHSIANDRGLLRSAGTDLHSFAGVPPARYRQLDDRILLPSVALDWLTIGADK